MTDIIKPIKEMYRKYSEKKFLKKHGCETWEQYNHRYDPDINNRASKIKHFYQGYPYVYCFEDHKHDIYFWDLGYDGTFVVDKWCKENLKGKFRLDFHRAFKANSTANDWEINEIGGGDYIFFACKDPKDFTLFMLVYS